MTMRRAALLGVIAVLAAACGDSTAPEDFSPTDTQARTAKLQAVIGDNEALASLSILGQYLDLGGVQTALAAAPFDATEPGAVTALQRLHRVAGLEPSFGAGAALALFPADLLGKTLVLNLDLGRYEVDDARAGAPAAGIRLILYAVNPVNYQVVTPLVEVGHLDLVDVSTASYDAIQLVAVIDGVTLVDYEARATVTTSSVSVAAEGFLSNGTDQVDFDLTVTVTLSSATLDYLVSADGNSVRLQATLSGSDAETFDAMLTVQGGGDTVVLDVTVTPSTVSGQITYNGDVAVEISGTPEVPVFERADGTPLTEQEIAALNALGEIIGGLFEAFDNLLLPAVIVLAFG